MNTGNVVAVSATSGSVGTFVARYLYTLLTTPIIHPSPRESTPVASSWADSACFPLSQSYLVPFLGIRVHVEERWAFFLMGIGFGLVLLPVLECGLVLYHRWQRYLFSAPRRLPGASGPPQLGQGHY